MVVKITKKDTGVLLTAEDVRRWKEEEEASEARIREEQARLAAVRRKLEAASLFVGDAEPNLFDSPANTEEHESGQREPLTEAVPRILRATPRAQTPRVIKTALQNEGFSEEQLGNYFYTVLMRLTRRGTIIKVGNGYTVPKESEAADDAHLLNGSSTASVEHRQASGGTQSGPVNPRPGGGT